ncbi:MULTISPECIES: D-2-hydroxyacid dehydrogenase [unclassified Planococcus (in: firmicutes)]|uniref:D-2-hydroxyacid dehydrogenase n=1 Tax=unclassified Planococcus (in: firmicutes) TaxID=2662419 RepID=UPI000C7E3311|nr:MULTISPECIES: D-2-hydroxyacid dehydrogenase [unclassified Planococcus (in: firmicutes)]PKG44670.1 D-2-hydroxyacid dehydrogenase [Planococcus sp. Urea-trap-24]PKG89265.1 D-2-hydroxyacid dehydrogenase [Planococcus sp. Urea-3u-39]PKH39888.1 D-2-hydroxyacid dehydrogenase [Planococcus sp. MB-3u-09]
MDVLFTFVPRENQQEQLQAEFPEVNFRFLYKNKSFLPTADIVVTYGEDLTAEDIESAENLKWIMVASAGIEKMPHAAIAKKEIIVSNVKGIHKTPMAESALAHLLALKRSLPFIYESQRNGEWNRKTQSSELAGSTAVLFGPGAIGSEIGRLLQAFGVKTIGCNRSGNDAEYMDEMVSIENVSAVLPDADIVLSVLPSTKETYHLLKKEHFQAMKEDAIFMNLGRGDLVEDQVMLGALENGEIGYAILDVFEEEPLPADHPYWKMDNVIISPHVSSHSGKYVERALDVFIPNLHAWIKGDKSPSNPVDMKRGY